MNSVQGDPVDVVITALEAAGCRPKPRGNGWRALCPAHDDHNPSLDIDRGDDGRVLLICRSRGCNAERIVAEVGLTKSDMFPTEGGAASSSTREDRTPAREFRSLDDVVAQRGSRPVHVWHYHDAEGNVVGAVARWDVAGGKRILPFRKEPDGSWVQRAMVKPRPLFGLPELAENTGRVWVVEGERCVDAARSLGLTATTSPGGSQAARQADWSLLAAQNVVILPDADNSGRKYARDVAAELHRPGAKVRILELPGLGAGEDLVEWLDARDSRETEQIVAELEHLARQVEPWQPNEIAGEDSFPAIRERPAGYEIKIISLADLGEAEDPDWLWPGYLARGFITLLTGLWKSGKTTLLAHLLRDLYAGGGLIVQSVEAPTLIVSEESVGIWARRRKDLGLDSQIHLVQRPSFARPSSVQWRLLVDQIAEEASTRRAGLVIFDTLPSAWCVQDENQAGEMLEALTPLRDISNAGPGLLLVGHPRKSDGGEATATRGSGALPGFVDIITELRRFAPRDETDRRRSLTAYGRLEGVPPEQIIELQDEGYVLLGGRQDAKHRDIEERIRELLPPSDSTGLTVEEFIERWPAKPPPGERTLRGKLSEGANAGRWCRDGTGVRNDGYRFRAAPEPGDSFPGTHPLVAGNES